MNDSGFRMKDRDAPRLEQRDRRKYSWRKQSTQSGIALDVAPRGRARREVSSPRRWIEEE